MAATKQPLGHPSSTERLVLFLDMSNGCIVVVVIRNWCNYSPSVAFSLLR